MYSPIPIPVPNPDEPRRYFRASVFAISSDTVSTAPAKTHVVIGYISYDDTHNFPCFVVVDKLTSDHSDIYDVYPASSPSVTLLEEYTLKELVSSTAYKMKEPKIGVSVVASRLLSSDTKVYVRSGLGWLCLEDQRYGVFSWSDLINPRPVTDKDLGIHVCTCSIPAAGIYISGGSTVLSSYPSKCKVHPSTTFSVTMNSISKNNEYYSYAYSQEVSAE